MKPTITLGEIEVQALVFRSIHGAGQYVVTPERLDTLAFWERYGHDAKQIPVSSTYGLNDSDGGFYAFYVEDCFDPSIAIIRADSWETAYEIFCDEFSDWMKIEADLFRDYIECTECGHNITEAHLAVFNGDLPCAEEGCKGHYEDRMNYNSSGVPIDTEAAQGYEIKLLQVIVSE